MSQAFSKNQAKPSQKKQMIILSALGVVLLGAVGHMALGHTPQSAAAQSPDGAPLPDAASDLPTKQPFDAMKDLAQDPTRNLLRGTHDLGADLDQAPNNPFAMDDRWRSGLTKPPEIVQPVEPSVEPAIIVPTPVRPAPVVNIDSIKLQGIVRDAKHKYAIVNGAIVNVGATVGDLRIVDILDDRILVVPASTPNAAPTEILEKGRLK